MKSLCTIIAGSLILGSTTSAELKLTAFRGNPFGVGKLQYTEEETNPDPVLKAIDCSTHRNALLQLGKEAYYPVVDCRPPGRQDGNSGRGWTVYFLFKPAEKVTITAPNGKQLTAAVEEDLHADHADHARDAKKLLKKKLHTLNEWMRKNSSGPNQEFFQDRDHTTRGPHEPCGTCKEDVVEAVLKSSRSEQPRRPLSPFNRPVPDKHAGAATGTAAAVVFEFSIPATR